MWRTAGARWSRHNMSPPLVPGAFEVGNNAISSTTSLVTTTSFGAIAAGEGILVAATSSAASTDLATVTDSAGNTYTLNLETALDANAISYAFVPAGSSLGLPNGGTVTCGFNGVAGRHSATVFRVPNLTTLDLAPARTTATAVSTSIASGTPAQNIEVMVGTLVWGANTPTLFVPGAGWTASLLTAAGCRSQSANMRITDGAARTFAPSWGNSIGFGCRLISLKLSA